MKRQIISDRVEIPGTSHNKKHYVYPEIKAEELHPQMLADAPRQRELKDPFAVSQRLYEDWLISPTSFSYI